MKKEELIAKGLSEEQVKVVLDMYNTEIKEYVPKSELEAVQGQIKTLESTVNKRDKQLKDIEKNVGDNETLKKQIETLQADNKTASEKYKNEITQLKINSAVDMALTKAGAKTLKAVKALIDIDKISVDESGNVTGVEEQIKGLAEGEDTKYLFNSEAFKGVSVGSGGQEPEAADISKMSYTEMCAYLEKNPDVNI